MPGLILLGAGSFALAVADLAEELGYKPVACVINKGDWGPGDRHAGVPVYDTRRPHLWPDEGITDFPFVSATIWPERRGLIEIMEERGYKGCPPLVWAGQSKKATIGHGSVICRGAVVDSYALVGQHVVVNRGALIGHHCAIEPYSFIGPGAILCGLVLVGEGAFVGAGAMVKESVTIGEGATVGMGAVVIDDVPAGVTVKGNPARE